MGSFDFAFQKVPGFESTGYVLIKDELCWAGPVKVGHPRSLLSPYAPQRPPVLSPDAWQRAQTLAGDLTFLPGKGLLLWHQGLPLPFPFHAATARFDRIRLALRVGVDSELLEACLQVVGLGPGLTPSGDDFLGGLLFALASSPEWHASARLARLQQGLLGTVTDPGAMLTNRISSTLMADLVHQRSYQPAHELLEALGRADAAAARVARDQLVQIGSTSGFDILAGILTAFTYDKTS